MSNPTTAEKPIRFLSRQDIRARGITWSRSTMTRKIAHGEFPTSVFVGDRHMWLEHEVDQWAEKLAVTRGRDEYSPRKVRADRDLKGRAPQTAPAE